MKIAICLELLSEKYHDLECTFASAASITRFLTGRSLYQSIENASWDMVIVGWSLPDMDGKNFLCRIKAICPTPPPVIFLTSQGSDRNVIEALELGAEDFIIEPVSHAVVRARIEALARRMRKTVLVSVLPETVTFNQCVFHQRHQYAEIRGQRIELSPKEYALAMLLFENIGRTLSREFLHRTIWGADKNIPSRSLDTHLSRLRTQFRQIMDNEFKIVPVYRVGYRLVDTTIQAQTADRIQSDVDPIETVCSSETDLPVVSHLNE